MAKPTGSRSVLDRIARQIFLLLTAPQTLASLKEATAISDAQLWRDLRAIDAAAQHLGWSLVKETEGGRLLVYLDPSEAARAWLVELAPHGEGGA